MYKCLNINKLHIYNIYNKVRECYGAKKISVLFTPIICTVAQKCNDYKTAPKRTKQGGWWVVSPYADFAVSRLRLKKNFSKNQTP